MARVVTRCRLSGHYLFMGLDVSREAFANFREPFARQFCPYCACEHAWYKSDSKFEKPRVVAKPRIQQTG